MWFEMHNHSHYSNFDGFDKVKNKVAYAKELGMKAYGLTDHGNMSGAIQLYLECKKHDIKPLIGCEVYFQPKFDPDKRRFHLCLFALNNEGYSNLCQIITEANERNFHRYAITTFEILEKYSEGILCTSGCIGSFIPQALANGKDDLGLKAIKKFKSIFGDNFYFEVQPIALRDEAGLQEKANNAILKLSKKMGIKCVMTTDAHFTRKEDFDTYCMMHELARIGSEKGEGGFTPEKVRQTYRERYMHSEEEIVKKFEKMHGYYPKELLETMDEIYEKIDIDLDFSESIPVFDDVEDSYEEVKRICIERLKETGRYEKKYIDILKYELGVIKGHGLCDFFLITRDYVVDAKKKGIYVGPGRGSVGGSLVADLLEITDIDPIAVGTDFDRFLRPDKKKMPDIDIDFESARQQEVIDYIIGKYKGRAAQIITFGYYKSANLVNDLCKVYGVPSTEIPRVKALISPLTKNDAGRDMAHFEFEDVSYEDAMKDRNLRALDKEYPGIVKHFCKLCGQVKYYGTHPAGVLVTKGKIGSWVPVQRVKGAMICSYDKYDIEAMGMLKLDVLALKTLDVLHEIEKVTGDKFERSKLTRRVEKAMYEKFRNGDALGIFQLNSNTAREILKEINADDIQGLIAAISLNRPGALQLKMHKEYASYKANQDKSLLWYEYTADSYGAIIYQEHVMRICRGMAKMEPDDVDKLMKFKFNEQEREILKEKFVKGATKHSKIAKKDAEQLFDAMALYLFNKGHGAGYARISEWQMYHKVKHPTEFWYATMKHEHDQRKRAEFMSEAVRDGIIIFLPHVNYTADFSIRKVDGDKVVQMGYNIVKNVGATAAAAIEAERKKNGPFTSYDDFVDRVPKRTVNSRVVESLLSEGALEFNKKVYYSKVVKFNSTLYMKGTRG